MAAEPRDAITDIRRGMRLNWAALNMTDGRRFFFPEANLGRRTDARGLPFYIEKLHESDLKTTTRSDIKNSCVLRCWRTINCELPLQ